MAFHPYPQVIAAVFNRRAFGPPRGLTPASACPRIAHPASRPRRGTQVALLRLAFAPAPFRLTSPRASDSLAHSTKGTPSHPEGCSDCSWAHGFRNCFTPLPGCFSPFPHGTGTLSVRQVYLGLPHGRGGFTRDSTSPALLGRHDPETTRVRLRGHHPLRPGIQSGSPHTPFYHSGRARQDPDTRSLNTTRATAGACHTRAVWPDPLSLATTHGTSFPAGTEMFHFPAYPPRERGAGP